MLNNKKLSNEIDNKILQINGPVWKAAKIAYISNYDFKDFKSNEFDIFKNVNDALNKSSEIFANEFINTLKKEKVSQQFALIIEDYIKSASLTGTIPIPDPTSGTVLSTGAGPVTGVISFTPITNQVKII